VLISEPYKKSKFSSLEEQFTDWQDDSCYKQRQETDEVEEYSKTIFEPWVT